MRFELALICLAGVAYPAAGFSTSPAPVAGLRADAGRRRAAASILMEESSPGSMLAKLPLRSAVLALITTQSALDLASELPGLTGTSPDFLGSAFDLGFFVCDRSQIRTLSLPSWNRTVEASDATMES